MEQLHFPAAWISRQSGIEGRTAKDDEFRPILPAGIRCMALGDFRLKFVDACNADSLPFHSADFHCSPPAAEQLQKFYVYFFPICGTLVFKVSIMERARALDGVCFLENNEEYCGATSGGQRDIDRTGEEIAGRGLQHPGTVNSLGAQGLADFYVTDINYFIFRKCTPVWRLRNCLVTPPHEITYVIKGAARYTINGVNYEVSAGDLLYLHAGHKKEAITFPDRLMHCFSIDFAALGMNGEPLTLSFPMVNHIGLRDDIVRHFHDFNYTWTDRRPGYTIKSRGLLLMILHRFLELTVYNNETEVKDCRIENVIRYIAQHYSERLTVEKLAAMVNLNAAYFGTLFNREMGTSVNHYIARVRIRNAENILRSGAYRVTDAAEQCGYSDMYHFYKHFKAITGLPPSKFIPRKTQKK
jgi:AraC-like DNA-binding protein